MDLNQVIQELIKERNRLDALIRALEHGLDAPMPKSGKSRRGRKFMSATERAEVADRMRRYWAARKGTTLPPPELEEAPREVKTNAAAMGITV